MLILIAWITYVAVFGTMSFIWLVTSPVVRGGLEWFNSTAQNNTAISQDGLNTVENLTGMFRFSWNWVIVIICIGMLLWVITYLQKREGGQIAYGGYY